MVAVLEERYLKLAHVDELQQGSSVRDHSIILSKELLDLDIADDEWVVQTPESFAAP